MAENYRRKRAKRKRLRSEPFMPGVLGASSDASPWGGVGIL
jgi:hypothetical protein